MTGTDVDEVDVHAVDVGDELRKRVQLRFRLAPVVAAAPIADQLLQPGERHALRRIGFLIGPARVGDAAAKVIERRLRHLGFEGPDRAIFGLGVAHDGKDAKPECQHSRQFVELHLEVPGE